MHRFWLLGAGICLLVAFIFARLGGCSGRTLEGTWIGQLPDVAESASLQIRIAGGRFEFATSRGARIYGRGRCSLSGDRLTLTPELVLHENSPLKRLPPPRDYWLSGTGNRMLVDLRDGGEPVLWERKGL